MDWLRLTLLRMVLPAALGSGRAVHRHAAAHVTYIQGKVSVEASPLSPTSVLKQQQREVMWNPGSFVLEGVLWKSLGTVGDISIKCDTLLVGLGGPG